MTRSVLGASLAAALVASVGVVVPSITTVPAAAAPVVSAPSTTYAIVRQISGVASPSAVAVDSTDDTVYVGSASTSRIYIVNGRTGTVDDSIYFGNGQVNGIAVNDADDTIYTTLSVPEGLASFNGKNPHDDSTVTPYTGIGGVAVNTQDGSVYVAGTTNNSVLKFDGKTGAFLASISTSLNGRFPSGVAVNSLDDSIYSGNDTDNNVSIINGNTGTVSSTIGVQSIVNTYLMMAVNQTDDTVYALNGDDDVVSVIDGRTGTLTDDTVSVGDYPFAVAVDQRDDTVYVTNRTSDSLSIIDGRTATLTDDTIDLGGGSGPSGVAIDDAGTNGGVIYVAQRFYSSLSVVARVTPTIWPPAAPVGDTLTLTLDVPQTDYDVDNGTVTTVYFDDTAVTPTAGAGDTWTVTVPPGTGTNVPVTVKLRGGLYASAGTFTFGTTGPSEPVLDSAVGGNASIDIAWTEIFDGGSPITDVEYALNGYSAVNLGTLTSPATITTDMAGNPLTPGTRYEVRIRLKNAVGTNGSYSNWSNMLIATTNAAPTPTPTTPPDAPTDVVAAAGDGRATVSWTPPVNEGSFAITDYRVVASPGGATCLAKAPQTTCTVERLTNGDTYTFTVQALNGAGWGASSESSNAVTPDGPKPTPTMMVTGSRGTGAKADRVFADGVTTHLVGRQVQARVHLSGQVNYENGSMRTVASDGTFTWQRRTKKTVYVYFRVADEPGVRSNRLIIRLNRP